MNSEFLVMVWLIGIIAMALAALVNNERTGMRYHWWWLLGLSVVVFGGVAVLV